MSKFRFLSQVLEYTLSDREIWRGDRTVNFIEDRIDRTVQKVLVRDRMCFIKFLRAQTGRIVTSDEPTRRRMASAV